MASDLQKYHGESMNTALHDIQTFETALASVPRLLAE